MYVFEAPVEAKTIIRMRLKKDRIVRKERIYNVL